MRTVQDHLYRAKRLVNTVANVLEELSTVGNLSQGQTIPILQNTFLLAATQMGIISDDIDDYLEDTATAHRREAANG